MLNKLLSGAVVTLAATCSMAHAQQQQGASVEERMRERRAETTASTTSPRRAAGSPLTFTSDTRTGQTIVSGPGRMTILEERVAMERAAFLGVSGVPVEAALREQLGLKRGVGVLVERVEKDSPADQAGLKQYDVIEKLDDQLLINGQQLAVLVRTHNVGDEIKLSIIRQGQRQSLTAKLIEKESPVLSEKNLWGMPGATSPGGNNTAESGNLSYRSNLPDKLSERLPGLLSNGGKISVWVPEDGKQIQISITPSNDGSLKLFVQDKVSGTMFEGPLDTDQQIKLIPAKILDHVRSLLPLLLKEARAKPPLPAVPATKPAL